jgi:hypothetical protein
MWYVMAHATQSRTRHHLATHLPRCHGRKHRLMCHDLYYNMYTKIPLASIEHVA